MEISKERWLEAQSAEAIYNKVDDYEEMKRHFGLGYDQYFKYLQIDKDLNGKSILEIGSSHFPALTYCHNYSKSYIIEPIVSLELMKSINGKHISLIAKPAEEVKFPKVDEVWLFNVLQHVIDPDILIIKAKDCAEFVRFFEPINTTPSDAHPHSFTLGYFNEMFNYCAGRYIADKDVENFHTHECAYGIYKK